MKTTLGANVHYYCHVDLQLRGKPDFELPEPQSASYIAPVHDRPEDFPPRSWVKAFDKRAGTYEDETTEELRNRLYGALQVLRQYDRLMSNLVHHTCIEGDLAGDVHLLPQQGLRHARIGQAAEWWFRGDNDRTGEWLSYAWGFLALLLASGDAVAKAERAGAVYAPGVKWLRERKMMR